MKKEPLQIAFIRTSSLGDVILSTSCLQILAKLQAPTKVYWLGSEPSLSLIHKSFPQIIPIPISKKSRTGVTKEQLKVLSNMDLVYDMQGNPRSKLLSSTLKLRYGVPVISLPKKRLSRASLVAKSYLQKRLQKTSSPTTTQNNFRQYLHHNQFFLNALQKQNILVTSDLENTQPCLPLEDQSFEYSDEMKFTKWVALAPGARYAAKRAPTEIFLKAIEHIKINILNQNLNINDFGLLYLGDQNDRDVCQRIIQSSTWKGRSLNMAGQLSLSDSAKALKQANVLLCNDSALLHISEAVRTPVVAMFGPTTERFGFAPYLRKSAAFSIDLGCRPCSKHGDKPCRFKDYLCFNNLNPVSISNKMMEHIVE